MEMEADQFATYVLAEMGHDPSQTLDLVIRGVRGQNQPSLTTARASRASSVPIRVTIDALPRWPWSCVASNRAAGDHSPGASGALKG